MAVMFVLFMVGVVGFRMFEEHGWGTWDRLRASPAGRSAILVGKVAPSFLMLVAHLSLLFAAGLAVPARHQRVGHRARGRRGRVRRHGADLGMLLAAHARTAQQVNVLANIGTTALAGIGGALVPLGTLPGWAQAVAPATPSYWAMRGFRAVILDGAGLGDVLGPVASCWPSPPGSRSSPPRVSASPKPKTSFA